MWLLWVVFVLVLWISVDCLFLRHKGFEKIPGPKGIFLLENALEFIMDPVKLFYYFRSLCNKYKYLYKLKLGPKKFVIIHNPEDIEIVISGTKNSTKGFLYRFIKPWLQEGLLLSDGSKWQHRRKILTPAFHFNVLKCFRTIFEDNSRTLVEKLSLEVDNPETNISAFISDFTLNSICGYPIVAKGAMQPDFSSMGTKELILVRHKLYSSMKCKLLSDDFLLETAMGTKLDSDASGNDSIIYKQGIHELGQIIVHRAQRVWIYLNWTFSLSQLGRKHEQLLKQLSNFRDRVINKRRETSNNNFENFANENCGDDFVYGKKRLAMLDLLLEAEKNGVIDAKGIGEEVDTFMFEGHDTTATALQFAFMLLANNPEAQVKVVEELDNIFGGSDREASLIDLSQMKFLECCIKESLRLYPPVAFIMRKIDQDLKLQNHEIPAGIDCAILIYDLHRRSDQFAHPQDFYPERFLKEPTWHPYGYIPFSAGPRNCIGQKFAMMEMKVVLSKILRHYRLLPVTKPHDVIFVTDFILRPSHPIYVKIERRI